MAMNAGIRKALGDRDIDPELVKGLADMTPAEAEAMSLMMLAEPSEFPMHILDKTPGHGGRYNGKRLGCRRGRRQ